MHHAQQQIKKEKKASIKWQSSLTVINLTENQDRIFFEEDHEEFSFNGEIYDVVRSEIHNHQTLLYCVKDTDEQHLIDNTSSATKNNAAAGKKSKGTIYSPLPVYAEDVVYAPEATIQPDTQIFLSFTSAVFSTTDQILAPPPRFA